MTLAQWCCLYHCNGGCVKENSASLLGDGALQVCLGILGNLWCLFDASWEGAGSTRSPSPETEHAVA